MPCFIIICVFIFFQKPKLIVTPGEVYKESPWEKVKQERQEHKLREKMVKRKYKNLYRSMMQGKKERAKEAWLLKKKRRLYEEQKQEEKKSKKKNLLDGKSRKLQKV